MRALVIKELKNYFFSPIGYILITFFILCNSLILFFFETNYNFIKANFIDINSFFEISPWLLIIIIPSICMRTFSEETSNGTIEILITKPISLSKILLGKYISVQFLIIFCFLLCTPYFFVINNLLASDSSIDFIVLIFSFISLILLSSVFILICICISLNIKTQFGIFLVSFLICFFDYYLINVIAELFDNSFLYNFFNKIGIQMHYKNLSLGIIYFNDIIYFALNIFLFFLIGIKSLKKII